jgi:hypothetical protein
VFPEAGLASGAGVRDVRSSPHVRHWWLRDQCVALVARRATPSGWVISSRIG